MYNTHHQAIMGTRIIGKKHDYKLIMILSTDELKLDLTIQSMINFKKFKTVIRGDQANTSFWKPKTIFEALEKWLHYSQYEIISRVNAVVVRIDDDTEC